MMPPSITSLGLLVSLPLLAVSQCQAQFDSGCLFMVLVMTDAEYTAFPLHVDAGENAIQRPVVVPPVLPPLGANVMLRDGFNRTLAHHEAWVTVPRSPTCFFCSSPSQPFLLTSRE
jgi:hypothetical protein